MTKDEALIYWVMRFGVNERVPNAAFVQFGSMDYDAWDVLSQGGITKEWFFRLCTECMVDK